MKKKGCLGENKKKRSKKRKESIEKEYEERKESPECDGFDAAGRDSFRWMDWTQSSNRVKGWLSAGERTGCARPLISEWQPRYGPASRLMDDAPHVRHTTAARAEQHTQKRTVAHPSRPLFCPSWKEVEKKKNRTLISLTTTNDNKVEERVGKERIAITTAEPERNGNIWIRNNNTNQSAAIIHTPTTGSAWHDATSIHFGLESHI